MLRSMRDGERLLVGLDGELDHFCAQSVRRELDSMLRDPTVRQLILDFSGLTFMDSSGIAVVLRAHRRMAALGGSLIVTGVPAQARKVFDAAGVPRLVTMQ